MAIESIRAKVQDAINTNKYPEKPDSGKMGAEVIDIIDNNLDKLSNVTDSATDMTTPDYSGGFSTPVNPLTTYASVQSCNFNPLRNPLKEVIVTTDTAGDCDLRFAVMNNDNSFITVHEQTVAVDVGVNTITTDVISTDFDYIDKDIQVLFRGSVSGIVKYSGNAGTDLFFIGDDADVYTELANYVVGIKITKEQDLILSNRYLTAHNARLDKINPPAYSFDLANELLTKTNIVIPDGIHIIDTPIIVPSGVTITGSSNKSVLKAGASCETVLDLTGVSDIVLKNFVIEGTGASNRGTIDTVSKAVFLADKGLNHGIEIETATNIIIDGLTIHGFDSIGLKAQVTSSAYSKGNKYVNMNIYDCYCGVRLLNSSEYSVLANSTINQCDMGVHLSSGNFIVSSSVMTGNRVNVGLIEGSNSGHGSITGCLMNHSAFRGLLAFNMFSGFAISGCSIIDAPIEITGSEGVNVIGGIIGSSIEISEGGATQSNMFANNTFLGAVYGAGTITITNNTATLLKNNYWMDGTDSSGLNN